MKKIIYLVAFVSFLTVTIKADSFAILDNHLLWIKNNFIVVYSISTPSVLVKTDSVDIDGNELKGIIIKDKNVYLYSINLIYYGKINEEGKFQLISTFNIPGNIFTTVKAGNSGMLFAKTDDNKLHSIKVQNGVFSLLNNLQTSTNMEVYVYENVVLAPDYYGVHIYTYDSVFALKSYRTVAGSCKFTNGVTHNGRLFVNVYSIIAPRIYYHYGAVINFTSLVNPVLEDDFNTESYFDWSFYGSKVVALDYGSHESTYPGNWINYPGLSIYTHDGVRYVKSFSRDQVDNQFNEVHINMLTGLAYIRYSNTFMCVMDLNGNFLVPTDVEAGEANLVNEYLLEQNYPNPFNPSTKISFSLPEEKTITLKVFNSLGQEVQLLAEGTHRAGTHTYEWNGNGLTSGTYFYRLQAGDFVSTKKMILIK